MQVCDSGFPSATTDQDPYLNACVFEYVLEEAPRAVKVPLPEEAVLSGERGQQHLSVVPELVWMLCEA